MGRLYEGARSPKEEERAEKMQEPWGITLTYTWDAGDRLTQITDSKGGTQDFTYDNASAARPHR